MRNSIAVMNTKGGVGKSTIVLAIAETLSTFHGKNVLVIDSDSQASVSSMLMSTSSLRKLQSEGRTLVDYLVASVLKGAQSEWTEFVVGGVSDVDDAKTVYLMPSDMQLTLFEREVSREAMHARLRASISGLLSRARIVFDVVLIDCPPGLSVLTESWLREADFHVSPTKPDYISVCGLDVFRRFQSLNPEMGFAENLGVVVNMKDRSPIDDEYHRWLTDNADNRCFDQVLPRLNAIQHAARYSTEDRSFAAKYPGEIGAAIKKLVTEMLSRLEAANGVAAQPPSVKPTATRPSTPDAHSRAATPDPQLRPAAPETTQTQPAQDVQSQAQAYRPGTPAPGPVPAATTARQA